MIIIAIIFVVIAIIGTLVALYLTTDMFKSNSTLFAKYIVQNVDNIYAILEAEPSEIEQMIEQSKLESNLKATVTYKDSNNNTDNTINKAELDISGQKDKTENYTYKDIRLVYENEKVARMEYIQDGQDYGIRLDGIKQFVTFKNEDLQELELKTGITSENLSLFTYIFDQIKITDFIQFTPSEKEVLSSTYLSVLNQNTTKANYQKKTNQTITVNGKTYKANGYTIKLNKEQFNELIIKILERVSKDEIILGKIDNIQSELEKYHINSEEGTTLRELFVKMLEEKIKNIKDNNIGQEETEITVYESNGATIKTFIKTPDNEFSIDLYGDKSGVQFDYIENLENKIKETNIVFENKTTADSQDMSIQYSKLEDGTEKDTIEFQISRNKQEQKLNNVYQLRYYVSGNEANIKVDQYLTEVNTFENKVELTQENNIPLNDLEQAQAIAIINVLQKNFNSQLDTTLEKIKLDDINAMLKQLEILKETELKFENTTEENVSEAERNRFNSQLTLFIGKEVDTNSILQLLEVTNESLKDVQIIYDEEKSKEDKKVLKGFILDIKRNTGNETKKQEMTKELETNKNEKFTIAMSYDENTKLINKITIVSNKYLE